MLILCAAATAVLVAYLAWLGWHAPYKVEGGNETGPCETSQVAGLVLTWVAILVAATWATTESRAVWVTTTTLVVVWCADVGTRRAEDGSLWPLGGVLLAGAAVIGGVRDRLR